MITANARRSVWRLLYWQGRNASMYAVGATAAWALWFLLDEWFDVAEIGLPTIPLAVVGGALGIFVSFRTNAAYDRWWEGRKLWGRLINTSRHWCSQVMAYIPDADLRERMVRRHIAYVHTLKTLLRQQAPLQDDDVMAYLDDEEKRDLPEQSNATHYLLYRQLADVEAQGKAGAIDGFRVHTLDESLRHLLDIQGGCERIKKTPVPPGYGFIAETLILYFSILFPLTIVDSVQAFAIPITVLVCLAFMLINEAGRVLEDPFTMFFNGLPLQNMSTTIEHNLLNRLGQAESSLTPIAGPDERGILM